MDENRIKQLVKEMTLEEKAGLCSGLNFWQTKPVERLGIPSVMMTDGPHGLRKQKASADHLGINESVPATCFPTAAGMACSWNRDLIRRVGMALGEECQAEDVLILLGPGANIKRSPLCGRNFEYFSEDPYLSTEMAANHILGVQSQGVGTSLKHFAANNQETRRMSIDAIVDERALREIYLASFEGAVKQGKPWTVMCSYNRVNGTYASQNPFLLTDVLRREWGFEGYVVSDWGAVDERVPGVAAGLDLEMPASGGMNDRKIVEAVRCGDLPEAALDLAVERVLSITFHGLEQRKPGATYDRDAHHQLAREAAREAMVLLKNAPGPDGAPVLPLKKGGKVAVIGAMAKTPKYQGGGSSHINPTRLDNVMVEVTRAGGDTEVQFAPGYVLESSAVEQGLMHGAVEAAKEADYAVIVAGLPDAFESEGFDRKHMDMPENQVRLIEAVAAANPRTVVVLMVGAPVVMPWLERVPALLVAYMGGQAVGGAIADLLYGDANPSGKLAETWPEALEHNPSYLNFPGDDEKVVYAEGIFVGYRYYDTKRIAPRFPFGYGLSYARFEYTDLRLDRAEMQEGDTLTAQVTVKNTGPVAGQEIVQLYVRDVASTAPRPEKELKGFAKVTLQPGESRTVSFILDRRAFAYWNTDIHDWHVESGEFEILAGGSSADLPLKAVVQVTSEVSIRKPFTRNSTLGDLMAHPAGAQVVRELMQGMMGGSTQVMGVDMEALFQGMMLRSMVMFSGGKFSEEKMEGLLMQLNGQA